MDIEKVNLRPWEGDLKDSAITDLVPYFDQFKDSPDGFERIAAKIANGLLDDFFLQSENPEVLTDPYKLSEVVRFLFSTQITLGSRRVLSRSSTSCPEDITMLEEIFIGEVADLQGKLCEEGLELKNFTRLAIRFGFLNYY